MNKSSQQNATHFQDGERTNCMCAASVCAASVEESAAGGLELCVEESGAGGTEPCAVLSRPWTAVMGTVSVIHTFRAVNGYVSSNILKWSNHTFLLEENVHSCHSVPFYVLYNVLLICVNNRIITFDDHHRFHLDTNKSQCS